MAYSKGTMLNSCTVKKHFFFKFPKGERDTTECPTIMRRAPLLRNFNFLK